MQSLSQPGTSETQAEADPNAFSNGLVASASGKSPKTPSHTTPAAIPKSETSSSVPRQSPQSPKAVGPPPPSLSPAPLVQIPGSPPRQSPGPAAGASTTPQRPNPALSFPEHAID